MARFKNFSIWRGRLPHWRADGERYYVTFRHRRALAEDERHELFTALLRRDAALWNLLGLCVLPDSTEMLFTVNDGAEFAKPLEAVKRKAGARIIKRSGERYSPFYEESFDRIIRDDAEFEERFLAVLEGPEKAGWPDDPEDYPTLWIPAGESHGAN